MNNIQKEALLKKRYNAEKRFKLYGILSIFLAISFLFILIFNIFSKGSGAFLKTEILLNVNFDQKKLGLNNNSSEKEIREASFDEILKDALLALAPSVPELKQAELIDIVSIDAELEIKSFFKQ